MWVLILWECSHLCRNFCCVVSHNLCKDYCVSNTVWQVVESTKLMSHGVVNTKECICECHTSHTGSICHFFTSLRIICSVLICRWKVLEYKLNSLHSKTICVICSHDRYICLNCMCHNVDTWSTCQSLRLCHHVVYVYDCHVWKQSVVSDWPFNTCVSVCDDCKWCYLRTCSWRCWDSYEVSFLSHLRECKYSLTDVHEVHSHIFEVCFRMLIHDPHDLSSVHCRSTTKSNDCIWLELSHLVNTLACTLKCRVWCYLEEACMLDSHFI